MLKKAALGVIFTLFCGAIAVAQVNNNCTPITGTITDSGSVNFTGILTFSYPYHIDANGNGVNAGNFDKGVVAGIISFCVPPSVNPGTNGRFTYTVSGVTSAGTATYNSIWTVPNSVVAVSVTSVALSGGGGSSSGTVGAGTTGQIARYASNGTVVGGGTVTVNDISAAAYFVDGGSTNTITGTPANFPGAYGIGQAVKFLAALNNTGATTINVSSIGAVAVRINNVALAGGEIKGGQVYTAVYNTNGGAHFDLEDPTVSSTGGATASNGLTDLKTIFTDSTHITIGSACGSGSAACVTPYGNVTAPCTLTTSGTSNGSYYVGIETGPSIIVYYPTSGMTLSASGCTATTAASPSHPYNSLPLAHGSITSTVFATPVDDRCFFCGLPPQVVSGTGINVVPTVGTPGFVTVNALGPQVIFSGTLALGTSSISNGSSPPCATVATVTATGVASTDIITWTPNGSIRAVTGYAPSTSGGLSIALYPTTNTINADVCNWTSAPITPGAVTLNVQVLR